MKKQAPKTPVTQASGKPDAPLGIIYMLILLLYVLVTVFMPNMKSLEWNGPKFLGLAIVNLLTFCILLFDKKNQQDNRLTWLFFRNKTGLAFSLFLLMMAVSFSKAINLPESVLTFFKFFTVMAAAYNLSILFRMDKRNFRLICQLMMGVLLIDSLTVLFQILQYTAGTVKSIEEIKSTYSNKNILTSAIFIKIPFVLWLLTFEKGLWRKLAVAVLFMALLSVFFMSTRTFYLGLIVLSILYLIFMLYKNQAENIKNRLKPMGIFAAVLIGSFLLFSGVQKFLYPRGNSKYDVSFTQRLATVASGEKSSSLRLTSWKQSAQLFARDPVLGIGAGNWKIRILEYENATSPDFSYMMKAHNDFIELGVETGIFGLLFYLAIFISAIIGFVIVLIKNPTDQDRYKYLFLPAFGLICYSADAFFNFPSDRPEIQNLFAIFIGAAVAFQPVKQQKAAGSRGLPEYLFAGVFSVILLGSVYVLYLNFRSLQIQSKVYNDIYGGKLTQPAKLLVDGFPAIPDVNIEGEPVDISKARYLIEEKQYDKALSILKSYNRSPWDSRREIFTSLAYIQMGMEDSAIAYAIKASAIKPLHFTTLGSLCNLLQKKGRNEEVIERLEKFVAQERNSADAWTYLALVYKMVGKQKQADSTIDLAMKIMPNDTLVQRHYNGFKQEALMRPYKETWLAAAKLYNAGKYPEAKQLLDQIMAKETKIQDVCRIRAICDYYCQDFTTCISDINQCEVLGNITPMLINLRGICYHRKGDMTSACRDFREAASQGDKDAVTNIGKFCQTNQ